MNASLGTGGIVLGFAASIGGVLTLAIGLRRNRPNLLAVGRTYAWMTLLGAGIAFAAMERALITRDYTVRYVAEVGSSKTPPLYNFAALWSALEGSILLWVLVLAGYTTLVAWRFRHRMSSSPCCCSRPTRSTRSARRPVSTAPGPTRCCRTTG